MPPTSEPAAKYRELEPSLSSLNKVALFSVAFKDNVETLNISAFAVTTSGRLVSILLRGSAPPRDMTFASDMLRRLFVGTKDNGLGFLADRRAADARGHGPPVHGAGN